jgi:phosphonate transport system substrate-binding protein
MLKIVRIALAAPLMALVAVAATAQTQPQPTSPPPTKKAEAPAKKAEAPAKNAEASARKADGAKKTDAAQGKRLFLAVSEGTSGSINPNEAVEKYRPLADVLSKAAGQPVIVSLVRSFEQLEAGMKKGEFDMVMARPSDYPARGVRDYGYQLLATAKPEGQCFFIVEKGSPLKTIEEAKGKIIMFPEKVAYMTKFCQAELRDKGFNLATENVNYAKEQGAVGWSVESKLSDVGGVASYSGVAKNWEKNGHRVLHKAPPRPYFPIIAHKRVGPEKIAKLQKALDALDDNDDGKKVLQTMGISGYTVEDNKRLLDLLAWLEKK